MRSSQELLRIDRMFRRSASLRHPYYYDKSPLSSSLRRVRASLVLLGAVLLLTLVIAVDDAAAAVVTAGSSRTSGDESNSLLGESLIPLPLGGSDTLDRALRFVINQLPAHGRLYLAKQTESGVGKGEPIVVNVEYNATSTNALDVVYVGHDHYFTRYRRSDEEPWLYRNSWDEGIDGCLGAGHTSSCRCPTTTLDGCPDSLTYHVRAGEDQSSFGDHAIEVNGRPSGFKIEHSDVIYVSGSARILIQNQVNVTDPDDDTYKMRLSLSISHGRFGLVLDGLEDQVTAWPEGIVYPCLELGCTEEVQLRGSPKGLKQVLDTLYYIPRSSYVEANLTLMFEKEIPDLDITDQDVLQELSRREIIIPIAEEIEATAAQTDFARIIGFAFAGVGALAILVALYVLGFRRKRDTVSVPGHYNLSIRGPPVPLAVYVDYKESPNPYMATIIEGANEGSAHTVPSDLESQTDRPARPAIESLGKPIDPIRPGSENHGRLANDPARPKIESLGKPSYSSRPPSTESSGQSTPGNSSPLNQASIELNADSTTMPTASTSAEA